MHPDFELNLITQIFKKFGVSLTTGSDVISAFVRVTEGVYTVLSAKHAYMCTYSVHCTAYSLSMLIFS